jgi:hypothetical protein
MNVVISTIECNQPRRFHRWQTFERIAMLRDANKSHRYVYTAPIANRYQMSKSVQILSFIINLPLFLSLSYIPPINQANVVAIPNVLSMTLPSPIDITRFVNNNTHWRLSVIVSTYHSCLQSSGLFR